MNEEYRELVEYLPIDTELSEDELQTIVEEIKTGKNFYIFPYDPKANTGYVLLSQQFKDGCVIKDAKQIPLTEIAANITKYGIQPKDGLIIHTYGLDTDLSPEFELNGIHMLHGIIWQPVYQADLMLLKDTTGGYLFKLSVIQGKKTSPVKETLIIPYLSTAQDAELSNMVKEITSGEKFYVFPQEKEGDYILITKALKQGGIIKGNKKLSISKLPSLMEQLDSIPKRVTIYALDSEPMEKMIVNGIEFCAGINRPVKASIENIRGCLFKHYLVYDCN